MIAALTSVLGLVVGALVAWSVMLRRTQGQRDALGEVKSELAVRTSELANARSEIARTREEHEAALENMGGLFENLSNRVLQETVVQFNQIPRARDEGT